MLRACLAFSILLFAGCRREPAPDFSKLAEEFVYTSLSFSPVSASGAGYHRHNGISLDELLDDVSPEAFDRQRSFYINFRTRLGALKPDSLDPQDRADYNIMQDQISLSLLELNRIQNYRHNPTLYVELIGNALFIPHVLEYAPKEQRIGHIIARLSKIPEFLRQARGNLTDSPDIRTRVAAEENEGNIDLIDKTLRATVPEAKKEAYSAAAKIALPALRDFQSFLKNELAQRHAADWRLGPELYREKFRYVLATDLSPEQVLQNAEADVKRVQARMGELAKGDIRAALGRIADRHATPAAYIPDARRDLEEARRFVREKNILTLPGRDNLQVIETPEFMRGIYAVGGFSAAPALEPQLGAFYWITPIPASWPAKRVESKLREYNFYKLKLLTIHEAMPGHYVQLEYANDLQPPTRRVLRSIFGNGPYVEGWGQYSTQVMLDEGYLDRSPELRLTFLKEELRVLANAIIDIRLHTMGMTDQQALDLMQQQTFQETEEATAKLQRAKLSSCQLPTYLVGWRDWLRVRESYKSAKGSAFTLRDFHDRALKMGAIPLPVLGRVLTKIE